MQVPVCYNGERIWQNGNVSGKVGTFGYVLNGIDWMGTYNGGSSQIGLGMNYRVTAAPGWWGFTCLSRWTLDANANQIGYSQGC